MGKKKYYKLAKKFLEDSGIGVDQNLYPFVSDLDFYQKVNKRWESTSEEKKELLLKRFESALSLPLSHEYRNMIIQLDETEEGFVELTEEETKILIYILASSDMRPYHEDVYMYFISHIAFRTEALFLGGYFSQEMMPN
jgi:hypothetical protein